MCYHYDNWFSYYYIMAKHQSTLGIVAPPKQNQLQRQILNEMLVDTSSSSQPTSLDELHSAYDIGDVHHFA